MKVIVAGTRTFVDYNFLKEKLDDIRNVGKYYSKSFDEIISGGAKGVDELGEKYAKENNISLKKIRAEWKKHGKSAGPIRNKQMAEYSDFLIAFWDGESKGTKSMIDIMESLHKPYVVIKIK